MKSATCATRLNHDTARFILPRNSRRRVRFVDSPSPWLLCSMAQGLRQSDCSDHLCNPFEARPTELRLLNQLRKGHTVHRACTFGLFQRSARGCSLLSRSYFFLDPYHGTESCSCSLQSAPSRVLANIQARINRDAHFSSHRVFRRTPHFVRLGRLVGLLRLHKASLGMGRNWAGMSPFLSG